ncbi:hypothetical protein [Cellulomonas denverensis]|uniref:Uncharacterized protein n=1 Tax=Cellulomonas denverensis TaxID=264297 RepID=A0A7X6QYN6_9CELL|nr:hypothetical protein [Cellulomonas denverensis]NKY22181.1 hypothetical protein [Cellulomonas denverensis]GIG27144.1 hypothetical protein Cde04nite_33880 [Cellulomonas denverensis]
MIRRLIARVLDVLGPAPLDMGLPESMPTVRECRADDLAVLSDEDLLGLVSPLQLASHPHEGTAAERIGGAR